MTQEETQYERNPNYIFRTIVDEAVLVPIRQQLADMDCIYTLNDVGAFVWARMDAPATRAALVSAILDEYAANPEEVSADLDAFLQEMVAIGAVRRV